MYSQHPVLPLPRRQWAESPQQTLHVAVAYSNPLQWRTRYEVFHDVVQQIQLTPNVDVHVGEIAYGDLPFEATTENECRFRANSILFHKENLLNEIIKRFPPDWKYGAYIDCDLTFTNRNWALAAITKLQFHPWVQLFSVYNDLSARTPGGQRPMHTSMAKSFAATFIDNGHRLPATAPAGGWATSAASPVYYDDMDLQKAIPVTGWVPVGATGGAWSFTRDGFNTVGGLLDQCILGHADWFMAFGLVSQPTQGTIADSPYHQNYKSMLEAWQLKAQDLKANIGVIDNFAQHHFHGSKRRRGYETRDEILVRNAFDPVVDLKRNAQGIFELTGNKPALRDDIHRYFVERLEDDPTA